MEEFDKQEFMTEILEISNKLANTPPWLVQVKELIRQRAKLGHRYITYYRISTLSADDNFYRAFGHFDGIDQLFINADEQNVFLNWLNEQGFATKYEYSWINVSW